MGARARPIALVRPGNRARLGIFCVAAAALLFPLVHRNDADIDSLANALTFAALALGLNIVVGFAGLLDLGYAAFFAIGAYAYGILSSWQLQPDWTSFWEPFQWLGLVARNHTTAGDFVHFQVSFWLMMPISAAIAAFFGVLFGAPTLRLKGDYLAIVTLGFRRDRADRRAQLADADQRRDGAERGRPAAVVRLRFRGQRHPLLLCRGRARRSADPDQLRLKDSRIGRAWMAIREDEIAAAAMGVNRVRFKLLAFATGAAFAGATGTLFVAKLQTATPDMFMFPVSVMILVMIVFGGHRQRMGRRARRADPADPAIVVSRRSLAMAARARPPHRCRVAAAGRAGLVDRADLRPHPRLR